MKDLMEKGLDEILYFLEEIKKREYANLSDVLTALDNLADDNKQLKASLEILCERTRNLIQPAYFCCGLEKSTEENMERNIGALGSLMELLVHVRASEELLYGDKS